MIEVMIPQPVDESEQIKSYLQQTCSSQVLNMIEVLINKQI